MSQPPPGYGPAPGYGPYPPARQTSSDAVVALVLSLLAWAVCPIVMAIVALIFASKAKTAIEASNGWLDGQGMVTAAKIIAWINIVLYVLGAIFFIIFFLFVGTASLEQSTTNAVISLIG
jgi:hypothetical protein